MTSQFLLTFLVALAFAGGALAYAALLIVTR